MSVSPLLRPLGITAAILGTLQGLTWTILSLLVILLSTEAWVPDVWVSTDFFEVIAYLLFFPGSNSSDLVFTGTTVLAFGCIYVIISFIWTVSSMTLTWVFMREKYDHVRLNCKCWSAITITTTILDLILVIILGLDIEKSTVNQGVDEISEFQYIVRSVLAIAMTIAARGFVLLLMNPILAICLLKYSNENSPTPSSIRDNRPIYGYQEPFGSNWSENPRSPIEPRYPSNSGFLPDEDPTYHRSVSQLQDPSTRRYIPTDPPSKPQQKPRAPQAPNQMQRDPRDNHNMRDPRDNNNMRDPRDFSPHIPAPDYYDSPRRGELERMPRSALKTKSYY